MAKEKRLQIIISTHSPTIVRPLPREAIHVLAMNGAGEVCSYSDVPADEAFFVLGHPIENKIQVVVEDILCKRLLEAVAESVSEQFAARFSFEFRPGGDSGMKQDASTLMLDQDRNTHFVFDGDKAESIGPFDLEAVSITMESSNLDAMIEKMLSVKIRFHQNSNMDEVEKRQIRIELMSFVNRRFHALPAICPEAAIWNTQTAEKLLSAVDSAASVDYESQDYKIRFESLTRALRSIASAPSSNEILGHQDLFIMHFCNEKGQDYIAIRNLLNRVANDNV